MAADRPQPGAHAATHLERDDRGGGGRSRISSSCYDASIAALDQQRSHRETWWSTRFAETPGPLAYFSAEFALHQSLPIYAGGLGVLAGDHCKEASDLGVPLIGVGFMYPQGYFHQNVSPEGWQMEVYERLSWADAPIDPALTPDGTPCVIAVPLGNRSVLAAVWRVRLGRVTLYLLDTDLEENTPWDRELSARLYGGDREIRIQQEIILGIGGVRALKALGIAPAAWHLNEGHAAFVVLQRIRDLIEHGETFDSALEEVRTTTIFTTHTPVPAGHDAFPFNLVETHLAGAWGTLGELARRVPGPGPLRQRQRTALQHDRAGAARGQLRQRREPAARPGDPRACGDRSGPVSPRRPATGPRDHQRRPPPDLAVVRHARAVRRVPRTRTGWSATTIPAVWEARAADPGRGAVARPQRAAQLPVRVHPRAGPPALEGRAGQRRTRRRRRHAARSERR